MNCLLISLQVEYISGKKCELGNELTPTEVRTVVHGAAAAGFSESSLS